MANNKTPEKLSLRIKLLRNLTLAPEARNEPSKGAYPAGRIKKFFDIFKSNYSNLSVINGLSLIFALPLLAVIGYIAVIGFENFTYLLEKMSLPYLMSDFGFGLSSGASLADVQLSMLLSYRVLILGIAITLPIYSFGLAGIYHIVVKLVWGEDFICKKDKFGNKVPRIVLEFFRGIKLFWKEILAVVFVFSVILAGAGNVIISFVEAFWQDKAGALEYIGLILSMLILMVSALVLVNLLPMTVSYKIKLREKLKNSAILSLVFLVPNMILVALFAGAIYLTTLGGLIGIILVVLFLMVGVSFFSLMFANFADYHAEKILTPLYEMSIEPVNAKKGKAKDTKKKSKSKGTQKGKR